MIGELRAAHLMKKWKGPGYRDVMRLLLAPLMPTLRSCNATFF